MAVDLSGRKVKVWLLHLKCIRGDRGKLSLNVLREVCAFLHPLSPLVHVTESYVRFFHFQTSAWGQPVRLNVRIQANRESSWVVLEDQRVFCCGGKFKTGGNTYMEAYILARDGTVESKTSMNRARRYHGVLTISKTVYVFGCGNL